MEYGMVTTLDQKVFFVQSIQFVSKWHYLKFDQLTGNPLFTMTMSQCTWKPVMMTEAFSQQNEHRTKALCCKTVGGTKILVMLGYHSNQQMLPM